jgi:hypothetical protein
LFPGGKGKKKEQGKSLWSGEGLKYFEHAEKNGGMYIHDNTTTQQHNNTTTHQHNNRQYNNRTTQQHNKHTSTSNGAIRQTFTNHNVMNPHADPR